MPVRIPNKLPARKALEAENIFVMTAERAVHQDIRPLKIAVLNLMPTKIVTETQILRLLGNTPLQVDVRFIRTLSHESKNTPLEHLKAFYIGIDDIWHEAFDGLIITGAPVENMAFEEVDYWPELVRIMDWSKKNVWSTFHICWGAQAGLWHHYGIQKHPLPEKLHGVFWHNIVEVQEPLLRGFDEAFLAPHSRHTEIRKTDIEKHPKLRLLSLSERAGVYIVASKNGRQVFVTGHPEYERLTLKAEWERDVQRGMQPSLPENYFPQNDSSRNPAFSWRSHAHLLYSNWLNYHVYQSTPYDLSLLT